MIRQLPYILLGLSILMTLILGYPGIPYTDTLMQYEDLLSGSWGDWHPPVMTAIWWLLNLFSPAPANIFLFQLTLFSVASFLWLKNFERKKIIVWGSCLLFLTPPIFASNAVLWKDVQMVNSFFLSLSCWLCYQRYQKKFYLALSGLALLYAVSVRYNAAAAVPFLLFVVSPQISFKNILRVSGVTLALFVLSLLLSMGLSDREVYPSQMVKNYDLAGIYVYGGQVEFPQYVTRVEDFHILRVRDLYKTAGLNHLFFVKNPVFRFTLNPEDIEELNSKWKNAIAHNLGSYLRHKWAVFTSFLRWNLEGKYYYAFQVIPTDNNYGWKASSFPLRLKLREFLKAFQNSFFYMPWIWTVMSLFLVLWQLIKIKKMKNELMTLGLLLNLSGLSYLLGEFFILPAADYRYFLWTYLMFVLSLLITIEASRGIKKS